MGFFLPRDLYLRLPPRSFSCPFRKILRRPSASLGRYKEFSPLESGYFPARAPPGCLSALLVASFSHQPFSLVYPYFLINFYALNFHDQPWKQDFPLSFLVCSASPSTIPLPFFNAIGSLLIFSLGGLFSLLVPQLNNYFSSPPPAFFFPIQTPFRHRVSLDNDYII